MLSTLSAKLDGILKRLRGHGVLTEATISEALKDVRLALLEADVHFTIVKEFIERIRVKAIAGPEPQEVPSVAGAFGQAATGECRVIRVGVCLGFWLDF